MKKHVLLLTGAALLSTSAYATKARMEALGQSSSTGSYYMSDTRNIFGNAAEVNNHKNYIVTEWGTASNTSSDSDTAPHAEGGFFREMGSFTYGLYLGDQSRAQNSDRNGQNSAYQMHDNAMDLFFAGDMGVQWGARLHYAKGNNKVTGGEAKQSALGLGLGAIFGDASVYANLGLSDKSEGTVSGTTVDSGAKWEADSPMNIGAAYNWNDLTFFVDFDKTGWKNTATTGSKENTKEATTLEIGVGHLHEVSSTARLNMDISFYKNTSETNDGTGSTTSTSETTVTKLPLTIGFEADANSWLTLRGSITQAIIINNSETKSGTSTTETTPSTTDVTAGATLNFGKLKVDGAIGAASGYSSEAGKLQLDTMMTRVGVHYWF